MKVAVLGRCGHWSLVTEALAADPALAAGLELHAAPGTPEEDMAPVAAALRGLGARIALHADWRALLDSVRPDAAVINPRFDAIGPLTRACLERGIHALSEKPIAIARDDLRAVRLLASAPGAPKLASTFMMRYDPVFLAGRRFLERGGLGRLALLSAQKSYPLEGWDGQPRPDFYQARSTYGGTIPWVALHAIDLIRWYAGSEFASVAAAHTTAGNRGHGELESAAVMHFRMESGAVASAHVDFLRRRAKDAAGKALDPWGDDRIRVAGEDGLLEIRDGRAWAVPADGARIELEPEPVRPLFAAFLAWVGRDEPMLMTAADCLAAAEASLAARDSADRRADP